MQDMNSDSEDSNRIYWDERGQGTGPDVDLLRYAGGGVDGALPFTQAVCAACSSSDDSDCSSGDEGEENEGGDRKQRAGEGGDPLGEHRTPPPGSSTGRRRGRRKKRRANPLCGDDETPATIGKFRRRRSRSPFGAPPAGDGAALLSVIDSATKLRIGGGRDDGKGTAGQTAKPGRIRLPPLGDNRSKMNRYNAGPAAHAARGGGKEGKKPVQGPDEMDRYLRDGDDDGKSAIDLAREIEMTLDEAEGRKAAPSSAAAAGTNGVRNGAANDAAAGDAVGIAGPRNAPTNANRAGRTSANPYAAAAAPSVPRPVPRTAANSTAAGAVRARNSHGAASGGGVPNGCAAAPSVGVGVPGAACGAPFAAPRAVASSGTGGGNGGGLSRGIGSSGAHHARPMPNLGGGTGPPAAPHPASSAAHFAANSFAANSTAAVGTGGGNGGRRGIGSPGASDGPMPNLGGGGPGSGPPAAPPPRDGSGPAAPLPHAPAAAAPAAPDDEFDDDDEEWDFDAIDLSVAMTRRARRSGGGGDRPIPPPQPPIRHSYPPGGAGVRHNAPAPINGAAVGVGVQQVAPPTNGAAAASRGPDRRSAKPANVYTAAACGIRNASDIPAAPVLGTGTVPNAPDRQTEGDDEFGDDEEDWDLDAIDRCVAMTQSLSAASAAPAGGNDGRNGGGGGGTPGEFSDDDEAYASIDLATLTQRARAAAAPPGSVPPPPSAPVRNLRRPPGGDPAEPNRMELTRYVVRTVADDPSSFTRTLGVSPSPPSGEGAVGGRPGEEERLRRLIGEGGGGEDALTDDGGGRGYLHLRGDWYYTSARPGDVVHLVSLSGSFRTDPPSLPAVLHTDPPPGSDASDDLLLVLHPDDLLTPTVVSEAVRCPRLAVLQTRLGSTGLSSRSAVVGTLRHGLFERCLRERDASHAGSARFARGIVRDGAASLLGCGVTDPVEAFGEVVRVMPQIRRFLDEYTGWDAGRPRRASDGGKQVGEAAAGEESIVPSSVLRGMFSPCGDARLSIRAVHSTEGWCHAPELGLKGSVDATVLARTAPADGGGAAAVGDVLLPIELKTGHSQNPSHNHLAQLSTYTIMLRARHGSAPATGRQLVDAGKMDDAGASAGGMLLYLNHEGAVARHVRPSPADVKTLASQRNAVASDARRARRPRGVRLVGGDGPRGVSPASSVAVEDPPPPTDLPPLHRDAGGCARCYRNRECMMYAASASGGSAAAVAAGDDKKNGHGRLLAHFAGHLSGADLAYFRRWDRLIDLERHACATDGAGAARWWPGGGGEGGGCIPSLVLDEGHDGGGDGKDGDGDEVVRFLRAAGGPHAPSLADAGLDAGSYCVVSTERRAEGFPALPGAATVRSRETTHLLRASVAAVRPDCVDVSVQGKDIGRLRRLAGRPGRGGGGPRTTFRLDRDETSNGTGLLLQNLVNFFTLDIPSFSVESAGAKTPSLAADTDRSARRRRMQSSITRLDPPPRFRDVAEDDLFGPPPSSSPFPADLPPGCDPETLRREYAALNVDQRAAVLRVASAEDFALVQGLPGTGKSATVSFAARLLVSRGKRVLLSSYTHSAVDNLMCKLLDGGMRGTPTGGASPPLSPVVRIGRESSCHPRVRPVIAENLAVELERGAVGPSSSDRAVDRPSVDRLLRVVSSARIVGVSALAAPRSPLLAGQRFDVVIVDEAGQISQPAVLGAIISADSFVLVGDHMQLPPLVVSDVAESAGYGVSMLSHLAEGFPDSVAKLTLQYRMNEEICRLSNMIAYDGLLKCGNDQVRRQRLKLKHDSSPRHSSQDGMWLEGAIDPDRPVVFLDTDSMPSSWQGPGYIGFKGLELNGAARGAGGPVNDSEAIVVRKLVTRLASHGVELSSIGVITPFRSQLRALNEDSTLKESTRQGLEICTIDRFQGRDKSVIVISLVRSNAEGKTGRLLQDFRRLNVAFSRAREKIIVVGSLMTLQKGSDVLRPLLHSLQQRGCVHKLAEDPNRNHNSYRAPP